jgi:murein DD-endopeptidase MepM/ murein hydrolase activator NlpD
MEYPPRKGLSAVTVFAVISAVLLCLWLGMLFWLAYEESSNLQELVSPSPSSVLPSFPGEIPSTSVPGLKLFLYHPVAGDTYKTIAARFGLTEPALRSLNQANDGRLPPAGNDLLIPSKDGIYHVVLPGQSLSDIARAYSIPLKEVLRTNQKRGDGDVQPGEVLYLPGAPYLSCQDPRWLALMSLQTQRGFLKPTTGRFADGFGKRVHPITHRIVFHEGLDLAPGLGARVVASQDGKVIFAGMKAGYGRLIILDHGQGITSYYAHLDKILVKTGNTVKRGDLIGKVGESGKVTGPHLHFEIRVDGKPQNPLLYLVQ